VSNHVLASTAKRGDMLGFVSPKFSDVVGALKTAVTKNIIATKKALANKDSYGVMTTGYKLQYDRYNDVNRWVPGNGDDAGLCARAENEFDVWVSPAGFNRGHYVDCLQLAFNPDKNARDELYRENINPVATFPKDGTILYGDKTLQAKNSAFSWIGIRRLFNYLRKSIQASAKYSLFEFNTQFTRQAFKDQVEPILREIKGRNGIFDFYVRCDETNNTPTVIQKGEFLADIIIKPQYSIQGIRLSFTAVRREVNFDEVIVA
jgi:phage tail sheath protein FI